MRALRSLRSKKCSYVFILNPIKRAFECLFELSLETDGPKKKKKNYKSLFKTTWQQKKINLYVTLTFLSLKF